MLVIPFKGITCRRFGIKPETIPNTKLFSTYIATIFAIILNTFFILTIFKSPAKFLNILVYYSLSNLHNNLVILQAS